jgi:hypothetical protein
LPISSSSAIRKPLICRRLLDLEFLYLVLTGRYIEVVLVIKGCSVCNTTARVNGIEISAVGIKNIYAVKIADVNLAVTVHGYAKRVYELAGTVALTAKTVEKFSLRRNLSTA